MSSFANLRNQARALEAEAEQLLSTYSSFAHSVTSSPMEDENKALHGIEKNLSSVCS